MRQIGWFVLVLAVWNIGIVQTTNGQIGKDSSAPKNTYLTSTLVWQGDAGAVSQDGRYIFSPDFNTGDLTLRDLTTNKNRIIVAANNPKGRMKVYADASSISHDQSQIAYSKYDEGPGSI